VLKIRFELSLKRNVGLKNRSNYHKVVNRKQIIRRILRTNGKPASRIFIILYMLLVTTEWRKHKIGIKSFKKTFE
jgi:hypothetical protein